MGKYRKKPVVVEATQWFKNGDHPGDYSKDHDGLEDGKPRTFTAAERKERGWEGDVVRYFRHPGVGGETPCKHCSLTMHVHGWIDTLEGGHIVCPGDYIITGVRGEFYPCKPGIFASTYETCDPGVFAMTTSADAPTSKIVNVEDVRVHIVRAPRARTIVIAGVEETQEEVSLSASRERAEILAAEIREALAVAARAKAMLAKARGRLNESWQAASMGQPLTDAKLADIPRSRHGAITPHDFAAVILEPDDARRATMPGAEWLPAPTTGDEPKEGP